MKDYYKNEAINALRAYGVHLSSKDDPMFEEVRLMIIKLENADSNKTEVQRFSEELAG